MQADYLLTIYFMLMSKRKKVKRSELASRAGVTVRTVSRAIDTLTLAGVPVYSESGPDGGYYIPDDYVITSAVFSQKEKSRIINCINAAQHNFNDGVCSDVLDKLNGLTSQSEEYLIKSDTLIIDASGWNEPMHASNKISVLSKAIDNLNTVKLKYVDRYESSTERLFDPYCLVLKSGMWYVYGWCHSRCDFRLFKIARIEDLIVTDTIFKKLPSNVYEKLRGNFDREDFIKFSIEFTSLILPEIEEWLGTDCIRDIGRCYTATAEMFGGNQLVSKLLSFGSSLKVISPQSLREEVEIECKRMLGNYE